MDSVGDLLAARRAEPLDWKTGLVGTVLLHGALALAFLVASRLPSTHPFVSPAAVSVRLVPLSRVEGGSARPKAEEPSRPVIEKVRETPRPSEHALPLPEKTREQAKPEIEPPRPSKVSPQGKRTVSGESTASLPASGSAGLPGPAESAFGTSLSAFDSADFNYSYYVGQMLAAIGANWFKPTEQSVSPPVVYFRIGRDGTISDARIERSSGLPFVDRAALRAVLAASPLPPLPADFHDPSLGVHLKFE
jgi:protein TonB